MECDGRKRMVERRIRLYVTPLKFYELMHLFYDINSMEYPQLTDICMFIGTRNQTIQ